MRLQLIIQQTGKEIEFIHAYPISYTVENVQGNGNTSMPKMGMGRVHVRMGMEMATFSFVPNFPSIGRLDANAICDSDTVH